ncbi:MAG: hypothetical protein ACRDKT_04490 [Actinomycetota bacterium]
MRPRSKRGAARIAATLLAAGLLSAGTYAFTASNTVPATRAGDGSAAITGFTVTNVQYNPSALDPTLLASYEFDLDATASVVNAKPVTGQLLYDSCTNTVGNHWSCPATAGTTIVSLDNLRVVATQ